VEFLLSLPGDQWPTAVACSTDRLAISLMSTLRTHRIQIPQEISVIGCDDIADARDAGVPLTTIRLSTRKIAEQGWGLLQRVLNSVEGDCCAKPVERVIVEPELIIRESVRSIH
jgi:LacI family transcriptional regulator